MQFMGISNTFSVWLQTTKSKRCLSACTFDAVFKGQNHKEHSVCESGADCWGMEEEVRKREREEQESEHYDPEAGKWAEKMEKRSETEIFHHFSLVMFVFVFLEWVLNSKQNIKQIQ